MILIGHRGKHNESKLPNSLEALKDGLELGYGIETDFRDLEGNLVLSHDRPSKDAPLAETFFAIAEKYPKCMLAINVKSDGIGDLLKTQLDKHNIKNYFTFDMSVPQMLEYHKLGLRFFTRQSEFERLPVLYDEASGVWLDPFENDEWLTEKLVTGYLSDGKEVCIVSPELHGRHYKNFWDIIASWGIDSEKIMICTDLLEEAEKFFGRGCK